MNINEWAAKRLLDLVEERLRDNNISKGQKLTPHRVAMALRVIVGPVGDSEVLTVYEALVARRAAVPNCPADGYPLDDAHTHGDRDLAILAAHDNRLHGDCHVSAGCVPEHRTLHLGITYRGAGELVERHLCGRVIGFIPSLLALKGWRDDKGMTPKFDSSLDSYVEWGEPLGGRQFEAVHITIGIPDLRGMNNSHERDLALTLMGKLDLAIGVSLTYRVVDYVAATDSVDWSVEAETYGRFA